MSLGSSTVARSSGLTASSCLPSRTSISQTPVFPLALRVEGKAVLLKRAPDCFGVTACKGEGFR